jgi:tight adherence protein C
MPIIPVLILGAIVLSGVGMIVYALAKGEDDDPLQERLNEYAARNQVVSLEEIELSLPFTDRVIRPMIRSFSSMVARFTPNQTIESTQHKLDLAGNPNNWTPTEFWGIRVVAAVLMGGLSFALFSLTKQPVVRLVGLTALMALTGFYMPVLWLNSKIRRRQDEIVKALPDALDLLTVCVEAGLGFDAAMAKVNEKWDNELSLAFGRVLQEIRLGRLRREALRDMANRMEVPDVTTFVAAIIQAEQLGVSIAKVLRIQSDQMRIRRRQRAEENAQKAPVKILFPMVLLIFPSLFIVLLGPAALTVKNSGVLGIFGGG